MCRCTAPPCAHTVLPAVAPFTPGCTLEEAAWRAAQISLRLLQAIAKESGGEPIDVVLHDGAPNVGGAWASEAAQQAALVLAALKLACDVLAPKGTFVTKIFRCCPFDLCSRSLQGEPAAGCETSCACKRQSATGYDQALPAESKQPLQEALCTGRFLTASERNVIVHVYVASQQLCTLLQDRLHFCSWLDLYCVCRSKDYTSLLYAFEQLFDSVSATKPSASRNTSAEIFVVCRGYKAPGKIAPELLDARHLFKASCLRSL